MQAVYKNLCPIGKEKLRVSGGAFENSKRHPGYYDLIQFAESEGNNLSKHIDSCEECDGI